VDLLTACEEGSYAPRRCARIPTPPREKCARWGTPGMRRNEFSFLSVLTARPRSCPDTCLVSPIVNPLGHRSGLGSYERGSARYIFCTRNLILDSKQKVKYYHLISTRCRRCLWHRRLGSLRLKSTPIWDDLGCGGMDREGGRRSVKARTFNHEGHEETQRGG
jgi:hypothetical protein